jgi:hypothetical protein
MGTGEPSARVRESRRLGLGRAVGGDGHRRAGMGTGMNS